MGVKSKAAAAILVLLLFLGSLWLREYLCVCVCGFHVLLIYTIPPLFEIHTVQIRNVSHAVAEESSMVVVTPLFAHSLCSQIILTTSQKYVYVWFDMLLECEMTQWQYLFLYELFSATSDKYRLFIHDVFVDKDSWEIMTFKDIWCKNITKLFVYYGRNLFYLNNCANIFNCILVCLKIIVWQYKVKHIRKRKKHPFLENNGSFSFQSKCQQKCYKYLLLWRKKSGKQCNNVKVVIKCDFFFPLAWIKFKDLRDVSEIPECKLREKFGWKHKLPALHPHSNSVRKLKFRHSSFCL